MKRYILRFALISGAVALGLLGYYAQAQRSQSATNSQPEATPAIAVADGAPPAIESAASTTTSDPFAASSLSMRTMKSSPAAEEPRALSPATEAAARPIPSTPPQADAYPEPNNSQYRTASYPSTKGAVRQASGEYAEPNVISPADYESAPIAATPIPAEATPVAAKTPAYQPATGTAPKTAAPNYTPTPASAPSSLPASDYPSAKPSYAPTAAPGYGQAQPAQSPVAAPAPVPVNTRPYNPPTAAAVQAPPQPRGTARPGSKQLEGLQAPKLTLTKLAPKEIQVGKPAVFKIRVRNEGSVAAHDVQVLDRVPEGTRLLETSPQTTTTSGTNMIWSLGTLEPGDEKILEIQLMPEAEGEIGSVASVQFRADASARTIATKPELLIEAKIAGQVMIGEDVIVDLKISNPGTGVATGVTLYSSLPTQLKHVAGNELEFDLGDLAPNESRQISLKLQAAAPGKVSNLISARGDGTLAAETTAKIEVISPEIQVSLQGPKRRFLERKAVYMVEVANAGTATANDVELTAYLPEGIDFVSTNNAGEYDQDRHAVSWSLAQLPEGEKGAVELVTIPTEAGDHKLRVEGKADLDLTSEVEQLIRVEGLSAIFFEVADVEDPVEVGGETVYEVRVLNQGTKSASNIVISATIPPAVRALSADGPTQGTVQGGRVIFEPLARLAPKADTTYRIRVQGLEAGDQRISVQLQSDDMRSPITKEESTRIYSDQ